jgi:RimJ/RimL family protein N-acetyltransferase
MTFHLHISTISINSLTFLRRLVQLLAKKDKYLEQTTKTPNCIQTTVSEASALNLQMSSEVGQQPSSARPLGKLLETPNPSFPETVTLKGRICTLEPLSSAHFGPLYNVLCTTESSHLWDYMLSGPFTEFPAFESYLDGLINNNRNTAVYFAILAPSSQHRADNIDPAPGSSTNLREASHKPQGLISLMDIKPSHRTIEIGSVLYSPHLQRTIAATEAVSLLLNHVFSLGYRRIIWKCNDLNAASKRAALRLGFKYEGLSRCHMVVKGRNRDTAWYSITEDDWPVARDGLRLWLTEGNFSESGVQKERLEDLRLKAEGLLASLMEEV